MQQIVSWLERLGLAQYAHCFAENGIDYSLLGDLTDPDLEKIGIQSLGHRRRLLRAIAELKDIEKNPPAMARTSDAPTASPSLVSAERRQVHGWPIAVTGKVSDAVNMLASGIAALRSTGVTVWTPMYLAHLARAYAELDQFDDARRCSREAMATIETTKERWCEAEVNRMAGEFARWAERDATRAEAYFDRALAVARGQGAKSWELRAALSLARLWRDQGKGQQARELLAPTYGWFTEGFDTLDLRAAKALLDELAQ